MCCNCQQSWMKFSNIRVCFILQWGCDRKIKVIYFVQTELYVLTFTQHKSVRCSQFNGSLPVGGRRGEELARDLLLNYPIVLVNFCWLLMICHLLAFESITTIVLKLLFLFLFSLTVIFFLLREGDFTNLGSSPPMYIFKLAELSAQVKLSWVETAQDSLRRQSSRKPSWWERDC